MTKYYLVKIEDGNEEMYCLSKYSKSIGYMYLNVYDTVAEVIQKTLESKNETHKLWKTDLAPEENIILFETDSMKKLLNIKETNPEFFI